ncbi:MAG TPA: endonuclease/exonuclease/phosphatase family protein [Mycobacteriales bacterium]|nr:endonuclease/exonuclease/phosphatase family protein [Mycobacteriales bacterium]
MPTLRVLSYNVRSLRDDREAVARVIRTAEPHVVCIQEAPRFLRWRSRAAWLARRAGLVVAAGGRPAAGNLLLCDLAVTVHRTAVIRLTPRRGTHRRAASVAVCSLAGHRFALVGTHLDLRAGDRLRHVHELFGRLHEVLGDDTLPLVLAGDINELPTDQTFAVFASRLQDTFAVAGSGPGETFSATLPTRRIDAIFADRRLSPRSCRVPDGSDVAIASDHRPVVAEIDLDHLPE